MATVFEIAIYGEIVIMKFKYFSPVEFKSVIKTTVLILNFKTGPSLTLISFKWRKPTGSTELNSYLKNLMRMFLFLNLMLILVVIR